MRIAGLTVPPLPYLRFHRIGDNVSPSWCQPEDEPWLCDYLHFARGGDGAPYVEFERRLAQRPDDARARGLTALVRHCLLALLRRRSPRPELPSRLRQEAFFAAATGLSREHVLRRCADLAKVPAHAVEAQWFADLPRHRPVSWPHELEPAAFALAVNRALAQGLLLFATRATLQLRGASRAVFRTASLHGAGLEVDAVENGSIRWRFDAAPSPFAARRRRALAALLPVLPWAQSYSLVAELLLPCGPLCLRLAPSAPLSKGTEPRWVDSELERTFAKAFTLLTPHWDLLREPEPCLVGGALVFPDFEVQRRRDGERWLLELAGLRDESARASKVAALHALPRLVLCLPRRGLDPDLLQHPRVVPFRRRVDAGLVLQQIERLAEAGGR